MDSFEFSQWLSVISHWFNVPSDIRTELNSPTAVASLAVSLMALTALGLVGAGAGYLGHRIFLVRRVVEALISGLRGIDRSLAWCGSWIAGNRELWQRFLAFLSFFGITVLGG